MTIYCNYCASDTDGQYNGNGVTACSFCGMTLFEDFLVEDVNFVKGPGGQRKREGFAQFYQNESASLMNSLRKGEDQIRFLVLSLKIQNDIEQFANNLYKIAAQKHFTRRYKIDHTAAACLYVACRKDDKPYLLIDFSEKLGVSVYVLGAVFLQLCQLLLLEDNPIVQKPVDPSLFIHRFTEALVEKLDEDTWRKSKKVDDISKTALLIIASMKRDWMQTGRKPSGLCGAAIYIAALAHGIRFPKSEVITVVHICDATLSKRLIEFENTASGSLTIGHFNERAKDFEKEQVDECPKKSGKTKVLCSHEGREVYAHGLCKECYDEFFKLSGGLKGGSDPPCFQRPEGKDVAQNASRNMNGPSTDCSDREYALGKESHDTSGQCNNSNSTATEKLAEPQFNYNNSVKDKESENLTNVEPDSECVSDKESEKLTNDEPDQECFSDVNDSEVDCYLHTVEETNLKTIIWEQMNKEYEEEQALKRAANAVSFSDTAEETEEIREARRLAAGVAANLEMARKKKRQQKAADAKNAGPARTAAEAAINLLSKKRLPKINLDVLQQLFDEDGSELASKKSRKDPEDGVTAEGVDASDEQKEEADNMDNYDEVDQHYQEGYEPDYDNGSYFDGNYEEPFNYEDDMDYS